MCPDTQEASLCVEAPASARIAIPDALKIFCNAGQIFPKEKVKAGSDSGSMWM